ncbi:hypothetical protein EHQ31_12245 [Leptospira montravelensis]|uniref:Lipoprotein n=1 Tax=Leptospira montravelensis TaxID=2484961 RepID=A0ABY2LPK2_9LEPT|nr:hypothetical protein [Leptospira montravelensis]TGK80863.1 hypothetical protein EHQ19_14580 [Leptospira montravelensis]TGL01544.1 hypothetical protein EHQ31_12245 [Leptospira montravelensis]
MRIINKIVIIPNIVLMLSCNSFKTSSESRDSKKYNYSLEEKVRYDKVKNKFILHPDFYGKVFYFGDFYIRKNIGTSELATKEKCIKFDFEDAHIEKKYKNIYSLYRKGNSLCLEYSE